MISFLNDFWAAFKAAFRVARQVRRRRFTVIDSRRDRAIAQAARLAAMTPEELRRCASQWGGAAAELKRRGLP